jgi:hypothetical protein
VGRHAAADDAPADPLVAAALTRRAAEAARRDGGAESGLGGLGWPGTPAPGDGRTGWPGGDVDDVPAVPAPEQAPVSVPAAEPIAEPVVEPASEPAPAESRRGWRRLFGQRAA